MSVSNLSNIALLFLVLHVFLGVVLPLVATFLLWRGMRALERSLRTAAPTLQQKTHQLATGVEEYSARAAAPVIRASAVKARWLATWRAATAPLRTAQRRRRAPRGDLSHE
ncbi:MAG: hypothetical protein NZ528_06180 [Caldilineales bacterium]|nr:hypothetical protein [Caldilineales bacterium]MDW8317387.1 hypothetical protein [Anaerolineae bacterium]